MMGAAVLCSVVGEWWLAHVSGVAECTRSAQFMWMRYLARLGRRRWRV